MTDSREKLRRFLRAFDITQDRADEIAGVKNGRTYSYIAGRSRNITREYLEPLAMHGGISVEWFFDGKDDYPLTPVSAAGSEIEVPVVGEIPSHRGVPETVTETVRRVRPKSAPQSVYRKLAEDVLPYFRRGDLAMVNPTDVPRATSIVLVEDVQSGEQNIHQLVRVSGELKLRQLADDQAAPPEFWKQLGVVVECRRTLANGLVMIYHCETGLTPDMLTV